MLILNTKCLKKFRLQIKGFGANKGLKKNPKRGKNFLGRGFFTPNPRI